MLDEDNNPIAPPQVAHDAAAETIDLVANSSKEEKVEEEAPETVDSEENDNNYGDIDNDGNVIMVL